MEIDIDDVTPTNITLQTHSSESSTSYLAQGSVATRLTWKRMVEESLDDFRRELNGGGMKDDSVVMIRDMERGRNMMLFGDTVVKYEGCQVEDVPMHMLADELARKSKFVFRPNVPWPLIAWATDDRGTQLTVKMENEIRLFKDPVLNINKPVRLFLPPLWVHITLDTGNIPTAMWLAIVMDEEDTVETTPIYRLPLPNVYPDGRICFGQVVSSLPLSSFRAPLRSDPHRIRK